MYVLLVVYVVKVEYNSTGSFIFKDETLRSKNKKVLCPANLDIRAFRFTDTWNEKCGIIEHTGEIRPV